MLVSGASVGLSLLVAGVVVGAGLLSIAIDYRRKRPFYGDLAACADDLEHPLWIFEMVDEPDYPEGRLAYEALSAVSKAANDDVSEYRRQAQDYREYVETWVHEAKSPLAAAHLMLENLMDMLENLMESLPADETGEVLLEKTEALGEELDRVEGFIEQALFFARSESLDRDYLIRPYSLQKLVGDAVRANARVLMGAHVAPYRIDLEQTVFTDEKWMNFILGQLIQNSAKYAAGEGAELVFSSRLCDEGLSSERIELEVREKWMNFILGQLIQNSAKYAAGEGAELVFSSRLCDEGLSSERIELEVRDNGCGVEQADLARVFDRGFTGENGRSGKRATGIGLYLVKRLCDKMGLAVRAQSAPGEYFAVTIAFPTNKMH